MHYYLRLLRSIGWRGTYCLSRGKKQHLVGHDTHWVSLSGVCIIFGNWLWIALGFYLQCKLEFQVIKCYLLEFWQNFRRKMMKNNNFYTGGHDVFYIPLPAHHICSVQQRDITEWFYHTQDIIIPHNIKIWVFFATVNIGWRKRIKYYLIHYT